MDYINKIFNEDCILGANKIPDNSVDLIIADPPYCLGKDYGNDSDKPTQHFEFNNLPFICFNKLDIPNG